jgi:hypothetical protein
MGPKCAQLTGFIGVILALDATLAQATLAETLGAPYATLLPVLYLIAVAALIVGAISAVIGGVFPQKTLAFDRDQFADFADGDIVLSETVPVKQTLIRSYGKAVSAECSRNTKKADALQIASICLAIGLLAVAGQVTTLSARTLNQSMAEKQPTQPKRPLPPAVLKPTIIKKGGDKGGQEKRG